MSTTPVVSSPCNQAELLNRAQQLAGQTLAQVAKQHQITLPANLRQAKGFVGQLLELALGADGGNQARPDFSQLNIELKSIPLNNKHQPQESTYICTLPLHKLGTTWHQSVVYQKLQHVLWIPVEACHDIALAERQIGAPLLWRPSPEEESQLEQDWQEIIEFVQQGQLDKVSAKQGNYLHLRPKAMNGHALTWTINSEGDRIPTLPRGFYLRSQFTRYLLQHYY